MTEHIRTTKYVRVTSYQVALSPNRTCMFLFSSRLASFFSPDRSYFQLAIGGGLCPVLLVSSLLPAVAYRVAKSLIF